MLNDNNFFKEKFIDYYSFNMDSVEKLLKRAMEAKEIISISLSDYESQIILFYETNQDFQDIDIKDKIIENTQIISSISNNFKYIKSDKEFLYINTNTTSQIEIDRYIFWKRKLLLYIIFDNQKINLVLANKKVDNLIKEIENLL